MPNLFAYRATKPAEMRRASAPRGERNDRALREHAAARTVRCAWGADGDHMGEGRHVAALLADAAAELVGLSRTKAGHRRRPLRKRADLVPQPFTPRHA
jgi:hypothetical protein